VFREPWFLASAAAPIAVLSEPDVVASSAKNPNPVFNAPVMTPALPILKIAPAPPAVLALASLPVGFKG
jgi:hypothetical protein